MNVDNLSKIKNSFAAYLLKVFLFLILFFTFNRLIFLLYNISQLSEIGLLSILSTFWHALALDIATACYFTALPLLLLTAQSIYPLNFLNIIKKVYFIIILLVISIITGSEIGVYQEWGVKLHYKAVLHLAQPKEVFTSITYSLMVIIIGIIILQFIGGLYFYKRFIYKKLTKVNFNVFFTLAFIILSAGLLILGARGGLKPISISQSSAYFSKHNILNDAAVNSTWNLMHNFIENYDNINYNPYLYLDSTKAADIVGKLYQIPKDTTISFLKTDRPNIVFIILESWTSAIIKGLDGYDDITPNFDTLTKDGILFTNIYSSAALSDQGIPAILSGFPAQPSTSIISQPNKYKQLACIVTKFIERGYHTSFVFGGQLGYGNIRSYIVFNKFEKVIEQKDFDPDVVTGRLGAHDEFILKRHLMELNKAKPPFFSAVFTMSTHMPYDIPMKEKVITWSSDWQNGYLNAAWYADKCLKAYFEEAKKQDWYDNTLFILVSDHSHSSPKGWKHWSRDFYRIPLLFYGEVIKEEFRGMKQAKLGSQVDIVATLLAQLNIAHQEFKWSKNLFNPYTREFAFYSFYDGFGWVIPGNDFVYENRFKKYYAKNIQSKELEEQIIQQGQAYMQLVFQDYLDY